MNKIALHRRECLVELEKEDTYPFSSLFMKQFLQDKYPNLLCDGELFLDSTAMEAILKDPRSLDNFLANNHSTEVKRKETSNLASGLYAGLAVRYRDFAREDYDPEDSFHRQTLAVIDHFDKIKDPTFPLSKYVIRTLLEHDRCHDRKRLIIHTLDGCPCLDMRFAIPIGRVKDVSIRWTGCIPSVVVLNEKLYIGTPKIQVPSDGYDFEFFRNTSELIGNHWAYQQIAHERVEGILIDLIRIRDMSPESEHIVYDRDFSREIVSFDQKQISDWQDNLVEVVSGLLKSAQYA